MRRGRHLPYAAASGALIIALYAFACAPPLIGIPREASSANPQESMKTAARLSHDGGVDEALSAYRQARMLFRALGDQLGEADTWKGEAYLFFRLGKNREALLAYQKAHGLYRSADNRRGWQGLAHTWKGVADVLFRVGKNKEALLAYGQALDRFKATGDTLEQAHTMMAQARVFVWLNCLVESYGAYMDAEHLLKAGGDRSELWQLLGEFYAVRGNMEYAALGYREARSMLAVEDKLREGEMWVGEADAVQSLGEQTEALVAYQQARMLFEAMDDKGGQARTWLGEALALAGLGKPRESVGALRTAARLAHEISSLDYELRAHVGLMYGHLQFDVAAAERDARSLLVLLERLRATGIDDWDRTVLSDLSTPYDLLIPRLARREGELAEAARLAEEAHAPVLRDLLGMKRPPRKANEQQMQRILMPKRDDQLFVLQLFRNFDLVQNSWEFPSADELLSQIMLSERPAFPTQPALTPEGWTQLVATVGPVLMYYAAETEIVAFLLRPSHRPVVRFIPWSRDLLADSVHDLRHHLANPAWEEKADVRYFYDLLIAPLAVELGDLRRLLIIPHGPLHQVPFAALRDPNGQFFGTRMAISTAPSLTALQVLRRRRDERVDTEDTLLALTGGTGLRYPEAEADAVAELFGRDIKTAPKVYKRGTFEDYDTIARRARYFLLGTHGIHAEDNWMASYLEIRSSQNHGNQLSASEIATIPISAELVVLAACDTAKGKAQLSDERLDLTRAFLLAGASAVLATHWKVSENASTRRFLLDFFTALRQIGSSGKPLRKDEALAMAQQKSRDRGDPAQLWASWVLIGDAR